MVRSDDRLKAFVQRLHLYGFLPACLCCLAVDSTRFALTVATAGALAVTAGTLAVAVGVGAAVAVVAVAGALFTALGFGGAAAVAGDLIALVGGTNAFRPACRLLRLAAPAPASGCPCSLVAVAPARFAAALGLRRSIAGAPALVSGVTSLLDAVLSLGSES